MIYKLRIILDAEEDVFRDVEIEADNTLEDFHNVITQAFGFGGSEMASFYIADDEWNQGEEIALFDMGDKEARFMGNTTIEEVVSEDQNKLIYIYDFLNMWTFYVELAGVAEAQDGITYPRLLFAHGIVPESAPEKQFETKEIIDDLEDLNIEDFDDLDFDENWN
ncbi:IS1096 element passenger TnpR family protein [Leptobacterium sp. I13]|uniref:IS1096 element passenger TnpR family protein n=1 Tax=Leptobacterium meishanense TaxID=3128904 RepID=UPI0030EF5289